MEMQKRSKRVGENPAAPISVRKCALCPYSTNILGYYKRHLKIYSSEKRFKCPESGSGCPYRAKWKTNVKNHVKSVHLQESASRSFPCPHSGCSYAAKENSKLNSHSKTHLDEKPLFCSHPNCNFSTKHKTSLVYHTRTHTGEKPYVCQFESCSYAAGTSGQLSVHFRSHTKERPHKCPEVNCKYSGIRKSDLKKHEFVHHPNPDPEERPSFNCALCEYSGKSRELLHKHINYRHALEKSRKCPIEFCDYRCKLKNSLDLHLKIHSQERRYKCELCPFRGKQRSVVSNHIWRKIKC